MKFDFRTSGLVTFTLAILSIATACPPTSDYRSALQPQPDPEELRAKRIETAGRMAAIGKAAALYIADYPDIGAPKVSNIQGLLEAFKGCNISTKGLQTVDAWNQPFVYEQWYSTHPENRAEFSLISLGPDGARDQWRVTEGVSDDRPGQDIVWRSIPGVLGEGGFTYGPSVIREQFPDLVARSTGEPTLHYEHGLEELLPNQR